ncbi:peptidase C14, caspase domain-containing protein [Boletus edulis]|nr:peptidase C14, caspase domain-containing protein [Boletus edulis]
MSPPTTTNPLLRMITTHGQAEPTHSSTSLHLSSPTGITIPSHSESPRKKKALLIAVQHVTRKAELKFGKLPDLRLSHLDAKALRECLIDSHGYHPDDIILMMDDKNLEKHLWPTHGRVLHQIDVLTSNAPEDCHFFFYFSGHGLEEDGGERASMRADGRDDEIVCADAKPILDHILHDRLVTPLQSVKGSKLFALFDCCHSETLLDLQRGNGPNSYSRKWTIGRDQLFKTLATVIVKSLELNQLSRKKRSNVLPPPGRAHIKRRSPPVSTIKEIGQLSVICLSACRDGQLAHDDCERRLTFTKCFMNAMVGKPNITWMDLREELKDLVSDIRKGYEKTCLQEFGSESDPSHETWTQEPRYCTNCHTDLTRKVSL